MVRVLGYYWELMRIRKKTLVTVLFFYTIGILIVEIFLPLVAREIIDMMTASSVDAIKPEELWWLFYVLVGLTVVHELSFRIADYTIVAFEARVYRQLSHTVMERLLQHSAAFFGNQFSGSLIAQAKRFVGNFTQLFETFVFHFWWSGWKVPAIIVTLFFLSPKIALIFLGWMIVYVGIVLVFVRYGAQYDIAESSADSAVTGRFSDTITNILTVKMFARDVFEQEVFSDVTLRQYRAQRTAWNFEITQILVQGLLFALLNLVSMYFSITLWLTGEMSTGTVVIIQLYIAKMFGSLWPLGRVIKRFVKGIADAQEMVEVFERDVDVRDPDNPKKLSIERGEILFESVSFSYGDTIDKSVIDNFTLRIAPGEKIGIVGASGAGKSTLIKLLLRFADVHGGCICIDGQDIRQVSQNDLRSQIAYVPQEPLLFHRSIRDNIAYGRQDATDVDIERAARMAHAHKFITDLPDGYDTHVGERGVKLSGGERQRIALARAILKDVPILIMDEATSALDSVSEAEIQSAAESLMQGKTTIIIAHRLSTLKKMNRIIVMEAGRIVESGTHENLLKKNGAYAVFWQQQIGGHICKEVGD